MWGARVSGGRKLKYKEKMLSGSGTTGTAAAKRRAAEEEAARSELFASDTPSPSLRRRYKTFGI